MRKHCGNCANYRKETNQFSDKCGKCVAAVLENGEHTDPSHWRALPQTNADRIRAMSDEELAKEMLFFCPIDTVFKGEDTYGKPHYTGLDGGYYATSEEVVASNLEWLKQPAYEPPKEESRQDCTYNKNGHCTAQKMMPECDAKNCDRKKP